jgi:uncharacterized protein YheU (UPF0270 family)
MEQQTRLLGDVAPTPPMALPSANGDIDTATLELLQSWRLQDGTDDPEAIRTAEQELTEFKRAMTESRTLAGEPLLY